MVQPPRSRPGLFRFDIRVSGLDLFVTVPQIIMGPSTLDH